MKNKAQKILAIVAAVFFLLCIIEGAIYYPTVSSNIYVQLMLNLQNAVEAFFMNSNIDIEDVADILSSNLMWIERVLAYAYIAAIVFAPLCTAAAIILTLKKFFYTVWSLLHRKKGDRVLVFGRNTTSDRLLRSVEGEYQAFSIAREELSQEKELEFLKSRIRTYTGDYNKESKALFKEYKLEKAKYVVLMEKEAMSNFSTFCRVTEYLKDKKCENVVTCILLCEDYGIGEMIREYYNQQIAGCVQLKHNLDLVLLNLAELEVREMFLDKPLYEYNIHDKRIAEKPACEWQETTADCRNPWDVHLVIAGFGRLGQQVLLQALNIGVMQSNASIYVDVFDSAVGDKAGVFLKRFAPSVLDKIERDITVNGVNAMYQLVFPLSGSMDGKVVLRFYGMDIRTISFENAVDKIAKNNPITYVAVCFKDSGLAATSIISLERCLYLNHNETAPIVAHLDADESICSFLKSDVGHFSNVAIAKEDKQLLKLQYIKEFAEDSYAMKFNYKYGKIDLNKPDQWFQLPEYDEKVTREAWQQMIMIKRESSRALSAHSSVKRMLTAFYAWFNGKKEKPFYEYLAETDIEDKEKASAPVIALLKELFENENGEMNHFVERLNAEAALREFAAMEHRRWCQFMITAGYEYRETPKDDVNRTNPCMLSWQDLCDKKPEYCQYDLTPMILL